MSNKEESQLQIRELGFMDIFPMSKIVGKLKLKLKFEQGLSQEEVGYELAYRVFSNIHLAEKEVISFVSSLLGITVQEVKKLGLKEFVSVITQLVSKDEFQPFLKQAMK
ncbi:hypothetical protein [Metabacillus litoralis]|uniref:hypothetical protein n=1 Tax=Metabacillus litoralis TaxID=152268 RepID=UPI00203FDEF4|nr:hypothetical protein [Metabacillus litoralis]MCM3160985.1 hypothetical protein [Metabacillus litoralis]